MVSLQCSHYLVGQTPNYNRYQCHQPLSHLHLGQMSLAWSCNNRVPPGDFAVENMEASFGSLHGSAIRKLTPTYEFRFASLVSNL